MNFPIIESISGLLAAIAAYFSIRAKKRLVKPTMLLITQIVALQDCTI